MQAYNSLSFSREIVVVFRRRGPKKRSRRDRLALLANLSSRLLFRWRGVKARLGSRPCENVREPRKRRTVFSITFIG